MKLVVGTTADGGEFAFPDDVVTSTIGILAKKGAGKSNVAVVLAEEMFDAGVPWVAIDPKGDWFGLRAGRDGGPGLPVVVFGGAHGDVPLEPTAGRMLANLVLEHRLTCVVDVSELTKAEVRRFLDAFGDALYRGARAEPLHLFLEEAHEYLPQVVRGEDATMVERWQKIVKMGRTKGLGVTIISQRSAAVNKDVLTQCDTLIALRTTSPQDRKAVKDWVDVHADAGEALKSLPSLANGEAWVWFPEGDEQLRRTRFRQRRTFDSGATPKVGEKARPPAQLADVDLDAIKEQMAETIEKAKADDPTELRKQVKVLTDKVHLLEHTLAATEAIVDDPPAPEIVEVKRLPIGSRVAVATVLEHAERTLTAMRDLGRAFENYEEDAGGDRRADVPREGRAGNGARAVAPPRAEKRPDPPARREPSRAPVPRAEEDGRQPDGRLGEGERRVLAALAQHPEGLTKTQVGLMAEYSTSGGRFGNILSAMRTTGLISGGTKSNPHLQITDVGAELAEQLGVEPLPTGRALLDHWMNHRLVGKAEQLILATLDADGPMGRAELAEAVGYEPSGGRWGNLLSRLRSLQLIAGGTKGDELVRLSATLQ